MLPLRPERGLQEHQRSVRNGVDDSKCLCDLSRWSAKRAGKVHETS